MIILEIIQYYEYGCNSIQISIEIDKEYRVFNKILKSKETLETIKKKIETTLEKIVADYTKNFRNADNIKYDYFITSNDDRLYNYTIYNLLEENVHITKITRNYEELI